MLLSGMAAALLASILAQAEAAPPEPPPSPPAPSPAPAASPTPDPGPEDASAPVGPVNAVAVHGRFAYRPERGADVAPNEGFSLGATFLHRYALVAEAFAFGVQLDFFHDHFSRPEDLVSKMPSRVTQDSFVVLQTLGLGTANARPWIAVGGGLTIASGPHAVVRGAMGVDITIVSKTGVVVRGDYSHPFGLAGGDLLDLGAGLFVRF